MSKVTRVEKVTRIYDRFQYFAEDCNCEYCKYNTKKGKDKKRGCGRAVCCCDDIRADAVRGGRIKRKPGWNK